MKKDKCIFCDNTDFLFLYNARDINQPSAEFQEVFRILKCKNCGVVHTDTRINDFEKLYKEEFRDKTGKRFSCSFEKIVDVIEKKRVNIVLKYKKKGRILDIGCGRGIFLNQLKKLGWEVYGTEICEDNVEFFKNKDGFHISKGDFVKAELPAKFFDVVTLWHVFEHIQNPVECLAKIKNILKDDGVVIMELPNIESLQARIFKENWFHLDVPRHLYHYFPRNLAVKLSEFGFDVIKIRNGENLYNIFGLFQSVLNKFCDKGVFFNEIKKNRPAEKFKLFGNTLLFGALAVPVFIFCAIENLCAKWSIFEINFKINHKDI